MDGCMLCAARAQVTTPSKTTNQNSSNVHNILTLCPRALVAVLAAIALVLEPPPVPAYAVNIARIYSYGTSFPNLRHTGNNLSARHSLVVALFNMVQ